ncbi:MAG: RHS repeat protein [Bdellovibrionales bacterium]|nr:RHS repeat protein [Bdellovibrionales bacterium]
MTSYSGSDTTNSYSNAIESSSVSTVADERFGDLYNRVSSSSSTISSITKNTNMAQSLSYPVGVTPGWFNYNTLTKTMTTNSKVWTSVFDLPTLTWTNTSPEGATVTTELNSNEQIVEQQTGSDTPWIYTYDGDGRLSSKVQGTTQNLMTYAYNGSGYLSSITNALNEVTSFGYDSAGRVTSVTLPDTRVISKNYDANGNLLSVTPPSRPAHAFLYNAMEEVSDYQPPSMGVGIPKNTTYTYNTDKQITLVTLPNSDTIGFTYNGTTGLLTTRTVPSGNYTYTYDSTTKQLEKIVSPNGPASVFDYYGSQIKDDEQRRNSDNYLFGKVAFTFDSEHRVSSRITQPNSSGGASTINYSYNDDDQLAQVGDLALAYSYPSGRLDTTTIGNITDSRTYDSYGNLALSHTDKSRYFFFRED